MADRKPNDDDDHNDDGKDYKLNFHVLEPHLMPELPALTLEVVSLSWQSRVYTLVD
jgi:hypothetical protein